MSLCHKKYFKQTNILVKNVIQSLAGTKLLTSIIDDLITSGGLRVSSESEKHVTVGLLL